ncbi:MAG: dihydropteroate synthase [Terracidiphilus sp.]|nr:dihydropteroate synthase [Terracidiphilus sp.]
MNQNFWQSKRTILPWKLRTRTLTLGERTLVMAIANITPDSFSDGGLFFSPQKAIEHGLKAIEEGAAILDLGAESTRPGSRAGGAEGTAQAPAVNAEEEQTRLLPVIEGILRAHPEAVISVDTYKASTALAAIAAGAEIVNDVSGFLWDEEMAAACAESKAGVVLSHTRGRPEEWAVQPRLAPDTLMDEVRGGLHRSLETAAAAGIPVEALVIDPGYGFGKRFEENFVLLNRQAELLDMGRPLLIGLSRKLFLGRALAPLHGGADASAQERDTASVAAQTVAILQGASIVRVHAVRAAVEAAQIADAMVKARS